jgi:hypothetical protein
MGRLVEGAEDEYQHVGVRDQQRQGPERGAQVPEQHTGDREHSEVGGGPSQRRPVRSFHQDVQLRPRDLVGGEADGRVVVHRLM